jgi:hypothetical protein
MRRLSPTLGVVLLFAACGTDEHLEASSSGAGGSTPTTPKPPFDAGKPDVSVTVKRTIIQRNPFGDVKASNNTLWDGDFEWNTAFADQYGWVNASGIISVSAFSNIRVGADCRSGMKCGVLSQNQRIAAVGVSPGDVNASASVWVKVPTGQCTDMGAAMIACDYAKDDELWLADADGQPDADGWCHYEGVSVPRERATCLYVESRFGEGEALVDDAVVRAAPGQAPTGRAFDAADRARIEPIRKVIREKLRPMVPERHPAREALERFLGKARG